MKSNLFFLLILFFAVGILLILVLPFMRDEGLYAMMIEEQSAHLSAIPTFLSYASSWKPILFFWVYLILSRLPLPLEAAYRMPSIVFGLGSAIVSYSILKKLGASDNLAFYSLVVFLLSFYTIYPFSALLMDSMALFLVLSSLRSYMEEGCGPWRFALAAFLAFLAFWTKLVIAFLVPILAIAYFYTYNRKTLREPLFLVSLLAVPFAVATHYFVADLFGLGTEVYSANVANHVYLFNPLGQFDAFKNSVGVFLISGQVLWFSLSLIGFLNHWKKNLFMSAWYVLMILPFLTSDLLIWYFLPFMLPLSYYAALALLVWKGEEKADLFFKLSFLALCLVIAAFASGLLYSMFLDFSHYKEAGLMLSGKENVLVIGSYSSEVIAYKSLPEMRSGRQTDFGWILFTEKVPDAMVRDFISDYHGKDPNVTDGSFNHIFTTGGAFRKDTNLTSFDYIAIVGPYDVTPPDSSLVFNSTEVRIYRAD